MFQFALNSNILKLFHEQILQNTHALDAKQSQRKINKIL